MFSKNLPILYISKQKGEKNMITVRDFIDNGFDGDLYIKCSTTHSESGFARVSYVRWPETDPWVVCPDLNAGLGLSFCVFYEEPLYTHEEVLQKLSTNNK